MPPHGDRYRRPELPTPADRLSDLAELLTDLAGRVREVVTTAVADCLGHLARDTARRVLGPAEVMTEDVRPRPTGRYPRQEEDWDDEDPWSDDDEQPTATPTPPPSAPAGTAPGYGVVARKLLAGGLWAASWWLRRRGRTVLAAVTMALATVFGTAGDDQLGPVMDVLHLPALLAGPTGRPNHL